MELEGISSVHAMLDYLWGLDEKKRMHILTFWWLWWANRNKLREGELPAPGEEIARRTRSNVLEYIEFLGKQLKKALEKWSPPAGDMVKINIAGSFLPGTNQAGWGVGREQQMAQSYEPALAATQMSMIRLLLKPL